MDISNIIYYTREDGKGKTLSLRSLCFKQDGQNLESIFYAVKAAPDILSLLNQLEAMFYDKITLEFEDESYILLKVIDVYQNINFLKLQKRKVINSGIYQNNK